jgi:glycosyltransferase involved in cell wall biosynthesis
VPATPLVSVVTPFYNSARYLRECIESVLSQSLTDFEYVLLDNCSTDGSGAVAAEYAARDARLRLVTGPRHLDQIDNFNRALGHVSPRSTYVKILGADDSLYPECLERMVQVADNSKSVALVSSYSLAGHAVWNTGLPYDQTVFSGRDLCRRQLLSERFFVGSLSSVLYRASVVRAAEPFLDPHALHADTERAYQTLRDHDFGFVHQILSCLRNDNESVSSGIRDLNPTLLDRLIIIQRYGRDFLDPAELAGCLRRCEREYYRAYVRQVAGPARRRFLAHHRPGLERARYRLSRRLLFEAALAEAADLLLNPKKTAGRLATRLGLRHRA